MADLTGAAAAIGRRALDLVFPPRCAGCRASGAFLCDACAAELPRARPPRCEVCWRPGVTGTCFACRVEEPAFAALRASFVYDARARELVHALKYRGFTALAAPMAALMASDVRPRAVDLVVPVPLSGLRGRTRGYNQAAALARELGRELALPVEPRALRRRRHAPPQARSPDAVARRRNVEGAFQARSSLVADRHVLLIDDVTTTGATLGACAQALRAAGSGPVWAFAFARED